MIRALEIVIVNLGFTSEAASQIIIFYKIIAKVKIYKRVKLVFYSSYPRSGNTNFCKYTCLLHGLTSYTEKH